MGMEMKIILVYMDVDKGKEGHTRNQKMQTEIEEKIEKNERGINNIRRFQWTSRHTRRQERGREWEKSGNTCGVENTKAL